jgi:hypothetical protein
MTLLAYWAESARDISLTLRSEGRQLAPLSRWLSELLSRAVDVFWGLVEANWNYGAAGRARDRFDKRVTQDGGGDAPYVIASGAQAARFESLGHFHHLQRGMASSFAVQVKAPKVLGAARRARQPVIIELGDEDEIRG